MSRPQCRILPTEELPLHTILEKQHFDLLSFLYRSERSSTTKLNDGIIAGSKTRCVKTADIDIFLDQTAERQLIIVPQIAPVSLLLPAKAWKVP
jgi:hypothetical protein